MPDKEDQALKRRAAPGLDAALILRLPGVVSRKRHSEDKSSSSVGDNNTATGIGSNIDTAAGGGNNNNHNNNNKNEDDGKEQAHYTIPLSTLVPDPKPIIVRREDGFEKRVLLKCGRCRVVVGYEIDSGLDSGVHDEDQDQDEDEDEDEQFNEDADEEQLDEYGKRRKRRNKHDRAIYLLPGSIVATEDLAGEDGNADSTVNGMVERNSVLKGMEREWMQWLEA